MRRAVAEVPPGRAAVFVDTNALLHYPSMEHIDWKSLCSANAVTLCLCSTVIHQLDDKKDHPLLSERAARVIREISAIQQRGGNVSPDVELRLLHAELDVSDFPPGFSPRSQDDEILAHALLYGRTNPDVRLMVCTEDLGMQIKCDAHGIPYIVPNGRLETPADALTKEVRRLREEYARLAAAMPDVRVLLVAPGSQDARSYAEVVIEDPPGDPQALQEAIDRANEDFPRLEPPSRHPLVLATTFGPPPEEYERYNREVDAYLADLPKLVAAEQARMKKLARGYWLAVVLANRGGTPAEDVHVRLTFPEGIAVFEKPGDVPLTLPTGLAEIPQKPKGPLDHIAEGRTLRDVLTIPRLPVIPRRPERDEVVVEIVNSKSVLLRVERVMHGEGLEVSASLFVVHESDEIKGFPIAYIASAANLVRQTGGEVHVKVDIRR